MSATAATLSASGPSARLPRWVNNGLVVLLGVLLALFSLRFLPQDTTLPNRNASGSVAVQAAQGPGTAEIGQRIAALHLFGDADAKPVVDEPDEPPPRKETKLNLQLAGVFAFEPQDKATAIISVGNGEQNAFGVGDKISGETRLKAVFPEYVVIDNRGEEELLRLPENVAPSNVTPIQPAVSSASSSSASNEDFSQPVELPSNPGELRDTLARNPSMLGRVVAAEPYQENGKLVGYRIMPKQNPEILEAQGILAGDVITRVNNIQLNSQKQGIRALRNAVKAENLEVTILRDGVEVPVSISLAQ